MYKVYNETASAIFFELFQKVSHLIQNCATRYLKKILLNANTEFQVGSVNMEQPSHPQ